MEDKQKCTDFHCFCDEPETCEVMNRHKKLLYCNASKCLWNAAIKPIKQISYHKDWVPLGDRDGYQGVCGRAAVGMSEIQYSTISVKHVVVKCDFRSDKSLSGHIDFAKLLKSDGTPYGGNIPEPVNPYAAYNA